MHPTIKKIQKFINDWADSAMIRRVSTQMLADIHKAQFDQTSDFDLGLNLIRTYILKMPAPPANNAVSPDVDPFHGTAAF